MPSNFLWIKVVYLLSKGRLCCVILCLYQYGSALFCDIVSVCTNMAVVCCVKLSVPVPMWQCSVVLYCECLYQYGSALLCDTVSVCTNIVISKITG